MGAYKQIYYHIVFGTKHRKPTIDSKGEIELFKYIHGTIKKRACTLYQINGMPDHLHILSDLHPTVCLADLIKEIKIGSGNWMKASGSFPAFEGWQNGYCALTYCDHDKDKIRNYIRNQKEHHKTQTFQDEFRQLLIDNNIPFDEKYLL